GNGATREHHHDKEKRDEPAHYRTGHLPVRCEVGFVYSEEVFRIPRKSMGHYQRLCIALPRNAEPGHHPAMRIVGSIPIFAIHDVDERHPGQPPWRRWCSRASWSGFRLWRELVGFVSRKSFDVKLDHIGVQALPWVRNGGQFFELELPKFGEVFVILINRG